LKSRISLSKGSQNCSSRRSESLLHSGHPPFPIYPKNRARARLRVHAISPSNARNPMWSMDKHV